MNFAQTLARLESMNADLSLLRVPFSYVDDNERWSARIEIRNNEREIELKARGTGPDVEDALRAAWAKIETIVNSAHFTTGFDIPLLTIDASASASIEHEVTF